MQIDMIYLFKNGFWLSTGQVVATICSFFLAVVFARFVPKDIYGTYRFILSLTTIIAAFSLGGIGGVVVRAIAQNADGTLAEGFRLTMKWGIISLFVGIGIALYYFIQGNQVFGLALIIAGISMPMSQAFSLYNSFFSGRKEFKTMTHYGIISTIGVTIAMVIAIILHSNIIGLIATYFFTNLFFDILFYIQAAKHVRNDIVDMGTLTYGKHLSLMNIFSVIGDQFDNIVIFHSLGPIPLSIYSYAVAPPDQVIAIFKNILSLILPRFSQSSIEDIKKGFMRKMALSGTVLGICTIGYIVLAPYFYHIFFPAYISSIGLSRFYALIIFLTVTGLQSPVFDSVLAVRTRYAFTIGTNILRIILMLILVNFYGIWGIVLANIITKSLLTVIGTFVVMHGKLT